jgi:hypothetical protein
MRTELGNMYRPPDSAANAAKSTESALGAIIHGLGSFVSLLSVAAASRQPEVKVTASVRL